MSNSGSCTPMISNPYLRYRSYHFLFWAKVRMQLMQVYSQKSIRTTLPRRPATVKDGELIHATGGALGMAVSGIEEGLPRPPVRPAPGPAIARETTWPPRPAKSSSAGRDYRAPQC